MAQRQPVEGEQPSFLAPHGLEGTRLGASLQDCWTILPAGPQLLAGLAQSPPPIFAGQALELPGYHLEGAGWARWCQTEEVRAQTQSLPPTQPVRR